MTTQDQIQAYHDLMDEITFTRQSNWQRRAGFRYWIDIYEGQTQKQRLTFTGSFVQVEGFTFQLLGRKFSFPSYYELGKNVVERLDVIYQIAG